jgi:hypothetical protein
MKDDQNKSKKLWLFAPLGILGIVLFIFLGGWIVMSLWNALLPPLFGLRAVSFWQALGILLLCRILFGGFGMSGRRGSRSRHGGDRLADRVADRVSERLENMTPEERERLRQRMHDRWGGETTKGETQPL